MSTPLFLNIIPFKHPVEKVSMSFTNSEQPGYFRFRGDKVPEEVHQLLDTEKPLDKQFVYTNFSTNGADNSFSIDLTKSLGITYRYYTFLIRQYLLKKKLIVCHNFLNDNEIWVPVSSINPKYNTFKSFIIRVQFKHSTCQPELLISYEGLRKVARESLYKLIQKNFDKQLFKKVIYNNRVFSYEKHLESAYSDFDKIYPHINFGLAKKMGISLYDKPDKAKYLNYHDNILDFYKTYINTPDFKSIIPHTGQWLNVNPTLNFRTSKDSNLMVYANNHKGHTPKDDIKQGPYLVKDAKYVNFIIIAHQSDFSEDATKFPLTTAGKLVGYMKGDLGFFSIPNKLHLPLTLDNERNIIFSNAENPLSEILEKLEKTVFPPENKYIALYITPFNKESVNANNDAVYYRIKEELLKKRVTSQVIERDTIHDSSFKFSVMNIGIAALAKLGSIPWRLDRPVDDELIVGIGAFCPRKFQTRYLGSAFCFANDGTFKGFDAFPENDLFALAGSIREAVQRFSKENKAAKRLIIHFYKTISKKEVGAILKELREKAKLNIPLIILTINKTESKDLLVFDPEYPEKMPLSGTYIPVGYNTYLLCNNTRYSDNPIGKTDGYPLPIKIKVQTTDEKTTTDITEIHKLIDQAYQFSRMYWKSSKQQNLPVTIKYPEMIAKMMPYFKDKQIPEFGKNNLWFL
jgi:hypothetical protein